MAKKLNMFVRCCLFIAVAASLFVLSSCKKTAPEEGVPPMPPEETVEAPAEAEEEIPPMPAVEPEEETEEAPQAEQEAAMTEPAEEAAPEGMIALDIELPQPMFVGTPEMVTVKNLEKPTGQLRGPFYAPEGTENVAAGKSVTSNQEPIIGDLEMITDGDKEAADGSFVEFAPGLTYVTIDLGAVNEIYAVVMWHYHQQARVYFDVIIQVSDDPDFVSDVKTIFNNDDDNSAGQGVGSNKNYTETYEGRLIDAKGVRGRYVRLYSRGNSGNDLNHYIEVEVYGKPVQ